VYSRLRQNIAWPAGGGLRGEAPGAMSEFEAAILEIVELTCLAACDVEQWQLVADRCQRLLPGTSFSLIPAANCEGEPPVAALAGWNPDYLKTYVEYYHKLNTYNEFLKDVPIGKVVRASQIVPKAWRESQVFYQEWLRPQGDYTHGAQVTLSKLSRITYDIPEKLGHLEGAAAKILRRVAPHFRSALTLSAHVQALSAAVQTFAGLLDRVVGAAVAIDGGGKILFANQEAGALLSQGEIIKQSQAKTLGFANPDGALTFQRILAGLLHGAELDSTSFVVRVGDEVRLVHVLPLRISRSIAVVDTAAPVAIVVLTDYAKAEVAPARVLQSTFGLSDREAIVALAIANGQTVKEAAESLGVSALTARNQLSAAMGKLEVRRRADLVTCLAGLTPALRVT